MFSAYAMESEYRSEWIEKLLKKIIKQEEIDLDASVDKPNLGNKIRFEKELLSDEFIEKLKDMFIYDVSRKMLDAVKKNPKAVVWVNEFCMSKTPIDMGGYYEMGWLVKINIETL